jgi:uncharacterized membrane protein
MYLSGILTILLVPIWIPFIDSNLAILLGTILLIPGGIDGVTQLIGGRESTNLLRILTGILLGGGIVLLVNGMLTLLVKFLY